MNKEQFDTLMQVVHVIQFVAIMKTVFLFGCYCVLCRISKKLE